MSCFSSKLVVTERDVVSPDSPSVEVLSADPGPDMLQSVELSSPQSVSSIELISPESEQAPELASPDGSGSTVEVISPEPEPMMESLESSVSSDMTLTTEHGQMEAQLEAAMVESEKKSSESGESSEIVRVEMTSDKTSSDIEVIRRNSGKSLSGHWLLSASLSKHLLTLQHTSLRVFHVIHAFYCSTFYTFVTFVTFSETANVST